MQVVATPDGTKPTGVLKQIFLTPDLQVCGEGFNDKTVQVRLGGSLYFVFREDLGMRPNTGLSSASKKAGE
jgi:hypothetical protein